LTNLKNGLLASAVALLVMLHPTNGRCAPGTAAAAAAVQMEHISIVAIGQGRPVILIPGLSSPRAIWDAVAPELAKRHRVYLLQINGFGGDDPKANLQTGVLDGTVTDLSAFIAREKLAAPAIVGHSLGGLVGLMLAKAHPGQVGRLMVIDSLPFIGILFAPTATVTMVEPQAKAMRAQIAASYGKSDDSFAKATAQRLALKPESQAKLIPWLVQADARVSAQAMYEDMTTDLRPEMAKIATPITLVYPWSARLPKERADAFYHRAYADAPHITFVGTGDSAHFVMLDQPAAFQAALIAFLEN